MKKSFFDNKRYSASSKYPRRFNLHRLPLMQFLQTLLTSLKAELFLFGVPFLINIYTNQLTMLIHQTLYFWNAINLLQYVAFYLQFKKPFYINFIVSKQQSFELTNLHSSLTEYLYLAPLSDTLLNEN